jgi:hypothetical protein
MLTGREESPRCSGQSYITSARNLAIEVLHFPGLNQPLRKSSDLSCAPYNPLSPLPSFADLLIDRRYQGQWFQERNIMDVCVTADSASMIFVAEKRKQ